MPNTIILLLANEKLTNDNFVKWKSNMNIALLYNNYKFVLMEDCLPKLATNVTQTVQYAYDRWIQANNKARCYLIACMSNMLRD